MTIKALYPSIVPSLSLDFANVKALDPRITFTRASSARYYDGKTVAKAEENLLVRSQEFETTWSNNATTVTANSTEAPDGTTTADTIVETASSSEHNRFQPNQNTVTSQPYVISVFAKASTRSKLIIRTNVFNGFQNAGFDLSAGTVTRTPSGLTCTITSVGNSWYRCVVSGTAVTGGSRTVGFNLATTDPTDDTAPSYTGDGTSGLFLWGAQIEQRSSVTAYTPTTTAPITNYVPVLLSAANNVARFDHNPVTGESLGLLIEEQRTNLLTRSEEFNDAAWTKLNSTITADTVVTPNGTLTGDKLVEDTTASNTHEVVSGSISFTSGTSYALSVYAKAAERSAFSFVRSGTGGASARFDLSNLTTTSIVGSPTLSINPVGNGWFRCTMSWTAGATASRTHSIRLENPFGTDSYTGDGTSGIYIWGAQLEVGAFPTSYIPTTTAAATRAADVAVMTGANFSNWYNQSEGTLFAQASSASASGNVVGSSDNTNNNRIFIGIASGPNSRLLITTAGAAQAAVTVPYTLNTLANLSGAYKLNTSNLASNGTLGTEDTACTIPAVDKLSIGTNTTANDFFLNGHIRKIAYYPSRLSNAQLQALTTV